MNSNSVRTGGRGRPNNKSTGTMQHGFNSMTKVGVQTPTGARFKNVPSQDMSGFVVFSKLVTVQSNGSVKVNRYRFQDTKTGFFYDVDTTDINHFGYGRIMDNCQRVQELKRVGMQYITEQEYVNQFRVEKLQNRDVIKFLLSEIIFPGVNINTDKYRNIKRRG